MNARAWRALLPKMRKWVPAGIKEDKHRFDLALVADTQKSIYASLESFFVLLPKQIVKKNAHGSHAQPFGPT
jgi:hypothetical protein